MIQNKLSHPMSGKTVILNDNAKDHAGEVVPGAKFVIEDWWDRISGGISWMHSNGNFAAMKYGMRSGFNGIPTDDNVVYGKIDGLGHIVHVSEFDNA
jgi:hypothetical protein